MQRIIVLSLSALLLPPALAGADLKAAFLDPAWDGEKVPQGQQCQRFGGGGRSPALRVENIPEAANALVLEFSDRSYQPMDDGGHGKIAYAVEPDAGAVEVPSVPGHTMNLPDGFSVVEPHRAPTWDEAGAYLPPCSGGRGNSYYVTVKAVHRTDGETHELASTELEMGKY